VADLSNIFIFVELIQAEYDLYKPTYFIIGTGTTILALGGISPVIRLG